MIISHTNFPCSVRYVFYEVDCLLNAVNPFIDINVPGPTLAQLSQPPLQITDREVFEAVQSWAVNVNNQWVGNFENLARNMEPSLRAAAKHMLAQKQR